ncbi:MAG: primosomal protein N' [Terriglobia bacterium]
MSEQPPHYADVIVDVSAVQIDKSFQYRVPEQIAGKVGVGSAVIVPFHGSRRAGYVIGLSSERKVNRVSKIADLVDEDSFFDDEMVRLCSWISKTYFSSLSDALRLSFPPGRGRRLYQEAVLTRPDQAQPADGSRISEGAYRVLGDIEEAGGRVEMRTLRDSWGNRVFYALRELEEGGLAKRIYRLSLPQVTKRKEKFARLACVPRVATEASKQLVLKAPKQERILEILLESSPVPAAELLAASRAPSSSLKALEKKGYVETYEQTSFREPDFTYAEADAQIESLTGDQERAVTEIGKHLGSGQTKTFLLQGVTGSGKTEVYLRLIGRVLEMGKTAIVLVPEIALTPQTVHRFQRRFEGAEGSQDQVAVLHSGLTTGERFDQWRRIRSGQFRVVVGARSALFAPVDNLGLLIVDEEHETSYKQEKTPRYQAREVALKRAELNGATVVLGSATPSIETKAAAEVGRFGLLRLSSRIGGLPLPRLELVDMRDELKGGGRVALGPSLRSAMEEALESDEKIILFLNRRGFSSFILCRTCGHVEECRRCSVSLTYHADKQILRCHHCDYVKAAPETCPSCTGTDINFFGVGTQRVEQELKALFPDIPVIRMDADTTSRRGAHRLKLLEFQGLKSGILLGTQMIAKGLDFPEVTLVGVVNADTALNLPDFRAGERTFQILMQVSGRAGRGPAHRGRVVIQTFLPESYAIQAALKNDYDAFYKEELKFRRELNYPPFCRLVNVVFLGRDEQTVVNSATRASENLADKLDSTIGVLGPAPAPLSKIRNEHRWHLLLKVPKDYPQDPLTKVSQDLLATREKTVKIAVDADPASLL